MLLFLLSLVPEHEKEKVLYIYEHFHDDMIRFARGRLKNAGVQNYLLDAEDIVQESLLRIVTYIDHINLSLGEQANRTYLFSIVANVIHDHLQKETHAVSLDNCEYMLSDDENFIEELHLQHEYEAVRSALTQLKEIYTVVLMLYYDRNMTTQQIADLLGIPVKTVQTRLIRGRNKLRDLLEVHHG